MKETGASVQRPRAAAICDVHKTFRIYTHEIEIAAHMPTKMLHSDTAFTKLDGIQRQTLNLYTSVKENAKCRL